MTPINNKRIIARCDELVKNGQKLSVTWSGGNDSGGYEVVVDGVAISTDCVLQALIDRVANETGHWSFAGDFDAEGEAIYNPETKTFEGFDTTIDSIEVAKTCAIAILIPEHLWFDRLDISITIEFNRLYGPNTSLWMANGPKTSAHREQEQLVSKTLSAEFEKEIITLDNCTGFAFIKSIPRADFRLEDHHYKHLITSFDYSTERTDCTDICIDLNEP